MHGNFQTHSMIKPLFSRLLPLAGLALAIVHPMSAAETAPRVAILGDSITFDGRWPTRVESALRGTPRFAEAEIVNFGLGSETVSGLSEPRHAGGKFPRPCLFERLDRILDAYQPTLVLACYGMNDGIYQPLDPARSKAYEDGILKLKSAVEKRGAAIVFITPPLHSADKPSEDPKRYDAVLDHYAEWLVARRADGWSVIDIRPDLKRDVAKAKQDTPGFVYAKDGVHPGDQGHAFIATSICRQLWPMWKLPGDPQFAGPKGMQILTQRNNLLKLAWLSHTKHLRPGVPAGLPLDEAKIQAAKLLSDYQKENP
jgi:lysophospholipase L1-like esterase